MQGQHRDDSIERNAGIRRRAGAACVATLLGLAVVSAEATITPTDRGAVIETTRYRAEFSDGLLMGLRNAFTGEEYLDYASDRAAWLPHLPAGMGHQHGEAALAAAADLHAAPWSSHAPTFALPNQRYPDAASTFRFESVSDDEAVLHYTELADGVGGRHAGDSLRLRITIDADTQDLMVVITAESGAPGVYGAMLALAPVNPAITVEAPIFVGIRLTHDMPPRLWRNRWPGYWDYPFIALNGGRRGAIGIWAADPELRYKEFYYRVDDDGIGLSFATLGLPPYDENHTVESVTWHIQAFDHHWAQAAARYRAWRDAHVDMVERPDWVQQVSFVNSGVNAAPGWLNMLSAYFEGRHLDRTVTFGTTIRAANFDTMHWDNRPYEGFADHMQAWKESGAKLMAYLNPMTMWDRRGNQESPVPAEEAERIRQMAVDTTTTRVFAGEPGVRHRFYSKHHLGESNWQAWFLDWVRAYIQEHGADGIYHDETYITDTDNRGLVDGMTPEQGLADYVRKAKRQNPGSIHASEHLNDVNLAGISLGIGAGIHWGVAIDGMRMQRIRHASPISAALAYPWGVIWDFPHFSDLVQQGQATRHHMGMDQHERRAQIAGLFIQNGALYGGQTVPYDQWHNELRMDRVRALTFVHEGLRPFFPEDWQRGVRSYFRAADGGEYRYADRPWGSAFIRVDDDGETLLYGRVHGVFNARTDAGIVNWALFNDDGPTGLNPDRYYTAWPDIARPAAYLTGSTTDGFLAESFVNETFLLAGFEVYEPMLNLLPHLGLDLHAPAEPAAVVVNGRPAQVRATEAGTYRINARTDAMILVWLREQEAGIEAARQTTVLRMVNDMHQDLFDSAWLSEHAIERGTLTRRGETPEQMPSVQISRAVGAPGLARFASPRLYIPFRSGGPGVLTLHQTAPRRGDSLQALRIDGQARRLTDDQRAGASIELPFDGDIHALIELQPVGAAQIGLEWTAAMAE